MYKINKLENFSVTLKLTCDHVNKVSFELSDSPSGVEQIEANYTREPGSAAAQSAHSQNKYSASNTVFKHQTLLNIPSIIIKLATANL